MAIDIIDDMLENGEEVTYWASQKDSMGRQVVDENGNVALLDPVGVRAFWIDTTSEISGKNGEVRMSGAVVFVGLDMTYNEILYRKPLNALTAQQKADPRNELFGWGTIQMFDKIPTLDYDQFVRKAFL